MAIENLKATAPGFLSSFPNPTSEMIREALHNLSKVPGCEATASEIEQLAREFENLLDVTMELGAVLKEEFEPWLAEAKKDIDPYYWGRYRRLLGQKSFPPTVVAKVDDVTDRTLDLLENPQKEGPWDRRGMVVGHVQSGKTANYTGLICKAADAGYKLIVVIAGIQNSLRNQTQERIDEGFVGRDSSRLGTDRGKRFIGVGKFARKRTPVTFTSCVKDFNRQMADSLGVDLKAFNVPVVFVIKKNASTLDNVINWLKEHNASGAQIKDAPMLLIDDEADNASIDINASPEVSSRINSQIRQLLNLFDRKCYVGYTATPFANIFIDPETVDDMLAGDLFPRDFIVTLDPPSNYLGADRIFREPAYPKMLRPIIDNEDILPVKHKIDHVLVGLPPSLKEAVRAFLLARSIRLVRGQHDKHNSMMVNASRFLNVQGQLRDHIHDYLKKLEQRIRYEGAKGTDEALADEHMLALYQTWIKVFDEGEHRWGDIQEKLLDAVVPIQILEINSRAAGALNYKDYEKTGLNVIAIGGFGLSRGLTLEGLSVSYFLRNSMMYDTLMQMGRWFGYRPGYEDLCKIWMTTDASGWYEHISHSSEELKQEIREMEQANLKPIDFGLKVRSHPESLIVTARNKMRSAQTVKVKIGLSNQYIETHRVWSDEKSVRRNRDAVARLVDAIGGKSTCDPKMPFNNYLWRDIEASHVLDFLNVFKNHPLSPLTDTIPVREYIENRVADELALWDIALVNKMGKGRLPHGEEDYVETELLEFPVKCQSRTAGKKTNKTMIQIGDKQRVASRPIEHLALESDVVERVTEQFYSSPKNEGKSIPDRVFRQQRTRPLLIVHLLSIAKAEQAPITKGIVAWGISFPQSEREGQTVEYVVNTTWWNEQFRDEIDEEMEADNA